MKTGETQRSVSVVCEFIYIRPYVEQHFKNLFRVLCALLVLYSQLVQSVDGTKLQIP